MNLVLVEFRADWADEFNVHGLAIMTVQQFADCKERAKNTNWHFGSNEGFEGEDLSDCLHVISINMPFIKQIDNTLRFYGDIVENRVEQDEDGGTRRWSSYKTWGHFPPYYELGEDE